MTDTDMKYYGTVTEIRNLNKYDVVQDISLRSIGQCLIETRHYTLAETHFYRGLKNDYTVSGI